MSASARLSLPFLAAGQAQKELLHNEALQILDTVVAAAVEAERSNDPPETAIPGECFLVGEAPTAAWAGKPHCLAAYSQGGWRFIEPRDGMTAYLKSAGIWANYRDGAWRVGEVRGASVVIDGIQVVGPQDGQIYAPAGGAVIDAEARRAIEAILASLRRHGLIAV